jgi:hypothetical protein
MLSFRNTKDDGTIEATQFDWRGRLDFQRTWKGDTELQSCKASV